MLKYLRTLATYSHAREHHTRTRALKHSENIIKDKSND